MATNGLELKAYIDADISYHPNQKALIISHGIFHVYNALSLITFILNNYPNISQSWQWAYLFRYAYLHNMWDAEDVVLQGQ